MEFQMIKTPQQSVPTFYHLNILTSYCLVSCPPVFLKLASHQSVSVSNTAPVRKQTSPSVIQRQFSQQRQSM
jgi:hypothetical protein